MKSAKTFLFNEFKNIRQILSDNDTGLELKNSGLGVISWTARGQLGLGSKIIALAGFQHNIYQPEELKKVLVETFNSSSKTIEYIQKRLRSAKEVFTQGGHVTTLYKDQQFRMHFDNKRILDPTPEKGGLLDSRALSSVPQGQNFRFLAKICKLKQYSRFTKVGGCRYKNIEDVAVLNFIKGLVQEPPMFNLDRSELPLYKDIVNFLKSFNPSMKVTENSIASLKKRNIKLKSIPKSQHSEEFIIYVQQKFKNFDVELFFRT